MNNTLPSDIASISAVNSNNDYQHMDDSYITGNVVKTSVISLPSFIHESEPSTIGEKANQPKTVAEEIPFRSTFRVPLPVHVNRLLQVGLVLLCLLAILTYSIDVILSHDVMLRQDKARRLSEQNAELSARLLKSISFRGIQESVLGQGTGPANLHVPDEVLIAKEVPPVKVKPFKPRKHHLPLLSGY